MDIDMISDIVDDKKYYKVINISLHRQIKNNVLKLIFQGLLHHLNTNIQKYKYSLSYSIIYLSREISFIKWIQSIPIQRVAPKLSIKANQNGYSIVKNDVGTLASTGTKMPRFMFKI